MNNRSDEATDDPFYADRRNFYKVEKWSRDGLRVELMICAGNNLDKARRIFGPRPIASTTTAPAVTTRSRASSTLRHFARQLLRIGQSLKLLPPQQCHWGRPAPLAPAR